jgi:hypothetical protein
MILEELCQGGTRGCQSFLRLTLQQPRALANECRKLGCFSGIGAEAER